MDGEVGVVKHVQHGLVALPVSESVHLEHMVVELAVPPCGGSQKTA